MTLDLTFTFRGEQPPAFFLMGPTASGKTDLAIALSELLPCELISVDSALIYRGMDIGTAKPTAGELSRAPHRLIDFKDPSDSYSAADFRTDALKEMAHITARGKIPVLVGGTMFYFKALRDGLAQLPPADQSIRSRLLAEADSYGWDHLHTRLKSVDPDIAIRIMPSDTQRLQRALEVFELTGRSMSYWHQEQKKMSLPYQVVNLAIAPKDRAVLYQRIEQRFRKMLASGFIEEVRVLYERGDLNPSMTAIRAVGYRQAWSYLSGEISYSSMVDKGIIATRQLAKRQLTWLRGWPDIRWLNSLSDTVFDDALKVIRSDLKI